MEYISWNQKLINRLVEIVKTGILLLDQQGVILLINEWAEELLGYSPGLLIGQNVEVLFFPEDTRVFLPNILKITESGLGFEGEALLRRKNGDPIFINLSTALYKEEVSNRELIIFTLQDLTQLKKLEKDYLDSERFAGLGKMTDQIAHQIRNPIASIGGFALRLAKEQRTFEEYTRYTEIIQNEAKHLEYIIDRLAEFTQGPLARHDALTLSLIFKETQKFFQAQLEAKPFKIRFPSLETLSPIHFYGDLALLVRALECIIQNALEAVSLQREVELFGEIKGNQVTFRIKDNGEGIPAENLPLIFDPFFTTKFNYLGLGLTMAKRIITDHKGRIEVDSEPGKGTEVVVTIPRDRRREIRTKLL